MKSLTMRRGAKDLDSELAIKGNWPFLIILTISISASVICADSKLATVSWSSIDVTY